MLGWLAAAAAPILIHLWSRRKYREMSFAAMEYLLAAVRRQTRRLLLEQWLLLALRTLLVVLVVLAVAEPYAERAGFAFTPGGHVHRVLVFDGSYSMAYKPADKTRFDRAKELARQIVEESPQGDAFTLVLMSSSPRVVVGTAALEPSGIVDEIENLQLPQTTADLPAAVTAVRRLVENVGRENSRLDRHEVYFLTDLQRITWAPQLSEAAAAEFLRQTKDLSQKASLFLMDLGQPMADNLAIADLRTTDPLAVVGRDVPLEVRLKNFGRQAIAHQPVELFIDGQRIAQKQVDLAAEGSATVGFSCRFDAPGEHAIEVRAAGDALDVDNHRYLALPVRQAIRALCIDGRPSGNSFHGAADYLAVALAPQDGQAGGGLVRAEVAGESALLERNLGGYDCLFLCNVAQFTAGEAHALDAYLQGGGSVVFFLGDQVLADRYNRELGIAGKGTPAESTAGQDKAGQSKAGQGRGVGPHLLPAQLGAVVDHPKSALDPRDYRHPIVQAFRGRGQTSLLTTPVFRYFKLALPGDSRAKTVLALANGDPLVVEQPVHRGRVVLVATSADPSWTAMPLWPSFVPLVQEIVAWCAAGQLEGRNVAVGEPIEASWAAPAAETPASVQLPDGRSRAAKLRAVGDYSSLSYADTAQSGIYQVRFGPPINRSQVFAVNVDTAEGELAWVDPDELRHDVWPDVPLVYRTSWQDLGAAAVGAAAGGGSRLHVDLLYAVLGLLFAESFLGWRLGGRDEG
jgi:hypothetical protein